MARIDLIRDAQRPKMAARALFKGPQGSGKSWTMLSVARHLMDRAAADPGEGPASTLLIDTERESALTYADVFTFQHLPWRAPYDPSELTAVLGQLDQRYGPNDVIIVDSLSHFWQGTGGILDIANGRVQGGWDKARPIQNALVEQLLAMRCHVLLGARMKNTVLITDNGKSIENVGLTITQDDALEYELNIVVQMDAHHSCTITKSRTTAVPVGRVFPGGHEKKLADDYAEWLAGGIPPANRDDVDRIVATFAGIVDKEQRGTLKQAFVEQFGMPHALPATEIPAALAWLEEHGATVGEGPPANPPTPAGSGSPPEARTGDESAPGPLAGTDAAPDPESTPEAPPCAADSEEPDRESAVVAHVKSLTTAEVVAELVARGVESPARNAEARGVQLGALLLADPDWPTVDAEQGALV